MNKILLLIDATLGGALGWWIGSFIGIMTAYGASIVFTALGIYVARLIIVNDLEQGGISMPYVNIRITKDGTSAEKKAELIRGVTNLLRDVLGKNPLTTVVIIDEVDTDNWGIGGETVTQSRGCCHEGP